MPGVSREFHAWGWRARPGECRWVRPVAGIAEVNCGAAAVGLRYRALILLAAFTSLRWGELAALTPADIDLDARTVRVTRQLDYHRKGYGFGPPKSKAGVRTVPFPELIVPDLREHLRWVPSPVSFVFSSSTGSPFSHSNFRRRVWLPALAAVALEGVHFHDLRHTGNQLTADAGANPKELMARMGQDSERAALIYLHSSAGRQRALADEVGRMAAAELAKSKTAKPSGTLTAREPMGPMDRLMANRLTCANNVRPDRDSNAGPTA